MICMFDCVENINLLVISVSSKVGKIFSQTLMKNRLFSNASPPATLDVIIIIIIMSYRPHGYPWPSLATFHYRSSPQADLLDYIPYLHITAVCMFELVVLLLLGHKWGSIGVHSPACLVRLTWIIFVMGGRWPYSWYFVGCCRQDLFNIARNILVKLPSSDVLTQ